MINSHNVHARHDAKIDEIDEIKRGVSSYQIATKRANVAFLIALVASLIINVVSVIAGEVWIGIVATIAQVAFTLGLITGRYIERGARQ